MTDADDVHVAAQLAADLADAHRRVRALDAAEGEKALASRRLLVIGNAAKHDVANAARRLESFLKALDDGRIPLSEPFDEQ